MSEPAANVPPTPPAPPRALSTTILEPGPSLERLPARTLALGEEFRGCRVLALLPVASAEANLWLVQPADGSAPRVLKHYRHGIRPKAAILHRLTTMRPEHVVKLFEYGEQEGRCFEIQEYLPLGTLADWVAATPPDEATLRVILAQISEALEHLQEFNVLHRDIKPTNILLRSQAPLDLVLTDFGISSVADFSIHLTSVSRTAAYCAPETVTGVVSRASDWWSVGVIMLELLTRRHPLAGMHEQAISLQLSRQGIPVPDHLAEHWRLLLQGLLTRDYAQRWGAVEVRRWLAGDRELAVCSGSSNETLLVAQRPYRFDGREFFDAAGLAEGLVRQWPEAAKHLAFGFLGRWLEEDLKDAALAARLREIQADADLAPEYHLPVFLLAMHAGLPLAVQGVILDQAMLASTPPLAAAVARSSLGRWLNRLRQDPWLEQWSQEYSQIAGELAAALDLMDAEATIPLLCAPREVIDLIIAERRTLYAGAKSPRLHELLRQDPLSRTEAILLAAARPALLLTPAQWEVEQRLDRLRQHGWWIDEALARRLLARTDPLALAPYWLAAKHHWEERARTPLRLDHETLPGLLSEARPDTETILAIAANRMSWTNTLGMRFVMVPGTRLLAGIWPVRVGDYQTAARALGRVHRTPHFPQDETHPVVWVSHRDARAFCAWLTQKEREAGLLGPQDGYRLPTDQEWSLLAGLSRETGQTPRDRNGRVQGLYPWGTAWPPPPEAGNTGLCDGRDASTATLPVGSFPPNELGLHDLGTTVMEWCEDRYDPETDLCVVRGGSWCHTTRENFVVSNRRRFVDHQQSDNLGFRCVLEFHPAPPPPPPEPPPTATGGTSPASSGPGPAGTTPAAPVAASEPPRPNPRRPFWKFF